MIPHKPLFWTRAKTAWAGAGSVAAIMTAISLGPRVADALAPITPVFWGQLLPFIDGRADKRDDQIQSLDDRQSIASLSNRIETLKVHLDVLSGQQINIDLRLHDNPSDLVALQAKRQLDGQQLDVATDLARAECDLATAQGSTAACFVSGRQ